MLRLGVGTGFYGKRNLGLKFVLQNGLQPGNELGVLLQELQPQKPMEYDACLSTSLMESVGLSFSESIQTPCPMRNG